MLHEWRPEPKQELFLSIPTTVKEAFYGGGAGSGKSDVLLLYGIVHRWHENPQFKQVFMRRTFPELRNEIVPRSRELYRRFGATLNKTEMCWTFPRPDQYGSGAINAGAMIFLGHCENEDDVHQYDTMQICLFTPDELTSITEWIYTYITFQRNRAPKDSGLPSITRAAGMPGGIGHTWTYKRFIKPYPKGGKIIVGKGGNKRIYVHATLEDNQHIDPTYKQSLHGITIEAERKAKLLGDWDAYQGQVFDEFRDRKFEDEPDNALHVIEPFEIPSWWPRIVVGDWGFAAMTWIGYAAISPNRKVYIYREQYWVKTKISEWAAYVKVHIDRENPRLIRFCKSAGQDRGQEHTIQQQIEEELGQSIELSNNTPGSRVAGKLLIHEYLRWKPKFVNESEMPVYNEEYAMWIHRNRGMAEYNAYMKSFDPLEPETNLPKLHIFKDACPILVEAIKACSYDKPKGNKPAEDIAEFDGDDPIDGLRYLVDAAEGFFDESNQEFKKVEAQERLVNQLNTNQDWTAFYRNMRKVETNGEETIRPVSRYRH
jgi:Terminase large subunit, T4likevirus-type, N-terminal